MTESEALNKESVLEVIRKRFPSEWFQIQSLAIEAEHELNVTIASYNHAKALVDQLCRDGNLEIDGSGLWYRLKRSR